MQRICYFIGCAVLSAGYVSAHPGHGNPATADGIGHYFSSPLHFGPIMAATVVFIAANYALRRRIMLTRRRDETLND